MMQQFHFWVFIQKNQNQDIKRHLYIRVHGGTIPKWKHPNIIGNFCISANQRVNTLLTQGSSPEGTLNTLTC